MSRIDTLATALSGCLICLAAGPLGAGVNLLANGDFDVTPGVTGWLVGEPSVSAVEWQPSDADDCLQSGLARLSNTSPDGFHWAFLKTCAAASEGETYRLSLEVRFLAGTATSIFLSQVAFWDGADCTGTMTSASYGLGLDSTSTSWTPLVWPDISVPGGSQSVLLQLILAKEPAGGLAQLEVDRVLLTPNPYLFADGVEVGETCRWDAALP